MSGRGPAGRRVRRRTSAGDGVGRLSISARSGVTTMQRSWWVAMIGSPSSEALLAARRLLPGLLLGLLDDADVHERRLGEVVPLALAQLLEAADGLLDRRDVALLAGERLGDDERLRQELLDAAGAVDDLLVLLAQFLDAEDGDDVLQFAVALEDLPDAVGDGEMLLADVLRREDVRVRRQRIDGGVDALLGDACARGRGRRRGAGRRWPAPGRSGRRPGRTPPGRW